MAAPPGRTCCLPHFKLVCRTPIKQLACRKSLKGTGWICSGGQGRDRECSFVPPLLLVMSLVKRHPRSDRLREFSRPILSFGYGFVFPDLDLALWDLRNPKHRMSLFFSQFSMPAFNAEKLRSQL